MSTLSQFFGGSSSSSNVPVELLAVGGGGAGGFTSNVTYVAGGGGGAGELVHLTMPIPKGVAYTITIGAGGTGGQYASTNGSNSSFGVLVAGGGGGGQPSGGRAGSPGSIGSGSGSGGHTRAGKAFGTVASIDLASFGYFGRSYSSDGYIGSGTYNNSSMINGAGGGDGIPLSITGSEVTYAKGGPEQYATAPWYSWYAGDANTGNGGQGAASGNNSGGPAGSAGGSGIVIIAYPSTFAAPASISGTYTTPSRSGYRVYRFTGSGSITL